MNGLKDGRHINADALIRAVAEFNRCWPHWWWELKLADISVGDRHIQGALPGLPDQWRSMANQGVLASLNPQPLPPGPPDIVVGLEIADRLIDLASMVDTVGSWLGHAAERKDGEAIARRLTQEVEDICPRYPVIKIKIPRHPWPDPDPDPVIIKLSPITQLAIAARFNAAATAAGKGPLGAAFGDLANTLTNAGLVNLGA